MKKPTLWIMAFAAILFSTSCTSYQIITLESSLPTANSNGFLFENDTIAIQYTFNGLNAPLDLNIYNKSNIPIYLNWNQSSVIINGQSFPLNPSQSKVNVEYSEVSAEFPYSTYTEGSGDGTIWHSDRSGFIPPQSNTTVQSMNLWTTFISPDNANSESVITQPNGTKIKEYNFDQECSPLDFRCYISYSDNPKEIWKSLDHHFWVESYYKCVGCSLPKDGNTFYLSKATGAGTALGVVAAIGAVAIIVSTDPDLGDSEL